MKNKEINSIIGERLNKKSQTTMKTVQEEQLASPEDKVFDMKFDNNKNTELRKYISDAKGNVEMAKKLGDRRYLDLALTELSNAEKFINRREV